MQFDIIDEIKKIKPQYITTFLSTIIFGIVSQGMGLFNKYSFNDDVWALFSSLGNTITHGRWMTEILSKIGLFIFGDDHYSLPVFNGLSAIVIIAISACILVSLFDIKNKTLCVCLGGIMIVFPIITGLFGYMFMAPVYSISILLSIIGAYIVCKNNNWKIIIGIILMCCAVGIYQACIPLILGVFVLYLIKCCIDNDLEIRGIIIIVIRIFVSVILFVLLYFAAIKVATLLTGIELSSYQGINTMGQASILDYYSRAKYAYGRLLILDESKRYYMYYGNIKYVYYLIIFVSFILSLLQFIRIWKINKIKSILLTCFFACIPLASNFIFVMVDPDTIHALMVYGQIIPFVMTILLLDRSEINNLLIKYISIVGTIALLLINIMYCRFDNECYLYAELSQQEAISYFTTLVTRIKSCDNYDDELPVSFVFIGDKHIDDSSLYYPKELSHINIVPYENIYHYLNNYERFDFMKIWCGYDPQIVERPDLESNKEVLNMTCYPDAGSIKVIDNTVVVRFQ